MKDFTFYTPTKVYFGRGYERQVGALIRGYGFQKVLLHYGGGSIKQNGLYDTVTRSLREAGVAFVELGGAQPNPVLSLVREGVALCRRENVELVLAVGGGSAIDSAKYIAVGAKNNCDPWLFATKQATPTGALPVADILTLSATGTETSGSAVITNDENGMKRGYMSEYHRPLFSILNPELTYTVSPYQTACGIVDIMMHTCERYMTDGGESDLTDRMAETVLQSTVKAGRAAMADPCDYEARATLMWAGSLSHNDCCAIMGLNQKDLENQGILA